MLQRHLGIFVLLTASAIAQQAPAKQPARGQRTQAAGQTQTAAQTAQPVAIRGGKLLTITKGVIDNGVLVMENGRITAVGAAGAVPIPRNARVIDATGMTVYPGLIDSQTQLGLIEITQVQSSVDTSEPSDNIMPHMRTADAFHAETELIPVARMNGITNAIVRPTERNSLPGQASFIQLGGRDASEMLLIRDIALPINFTGDQRRNESFNSAKFPFTRMGVMAQLRQTFVDAQDYMQKVAEFERKSAEWDKGSPEKKEGEKRSERPTSPKRDLKLEALLPYLRGERPVVLGAEDSRDLEVIAGFAREFNLKVILNHIPHTQNILDKVAAMKAPVIVGPIYEFPRENERYDVVYKLPAELQKRGVKIAFASYNAHYVRNLPYAAGYSVAFGLPYEEALRAITINPAEMWGVADQLGSLEPGKMANIVIANGDPLDVKTDVKQVFIAGKEIPMVSRQTRLREQYSKQ